MTRSSIVDFLVSSFSGLRDVLTGYDS